IPTFSQGHDYTGITGTTSLRVMFRILTTMCSSSHLVQQTCSGSICRVICHVLMSTSLVMTKQRRGLFMRIYRITLTLLLDSYIDSSSSLSRRSLNLC